VSDKPSDEKPRRPRFPRRCWTPGQVERVEEPERGGAYDRRRERRDTVEEIDDTLDRPPDKEPAER